MEQLIKPEILEKTKVFTEEQARLIIKRLKASKKEEREEAIFLVEVIFSILLRKKVRKKS